MVLLGYVLSRDLACCLY